LQIIDRIDDLWVRVWLGAEALGLYSRAYTFSTYPRELVAQPIDKVAGGTYAALKGDRPRLSQAFFRTNAILVRAGFFSSGLLFWIAPEFIILVLTDKWLPMLTVFRMMLIFAMLDPLKTAASRLMVSMGDAARPIPARLAQLATLAAGLFLLGPYWGIEGVAMAVNIMAVVGMTILFYQSRKYVDYSFRALFFVPLVALALALLVTWGFWVNFLAPVVDVGTFVAKTAVFTLTFLASLFLFERQQLIEMLQVGRYLRPM
jgi:O-antigen/teichoic acid export membrane protein